MASKDEDLLVHSEQIHIENVKSLCRLCTELAQSKNAKANRKSVGHPTAKWSELIKDNFQIDVSQDSPFKRKSDKICELCKSFLANIKERSLSDKHKPKIYYFKHLDISFWQEFDPANGIEGCKICNKRTILGKGGRQKITKRGLGTNYEHLNDIVLGDPKNNHFSDDFIRQLDLKLQKQREAKKMRMEKVAQPQELHNGQLERYEHDF